MARRRLIGAALAAVALLALAAWGVLAVARPGEDEEAALSAAVNAVAADDPSAGTWGECDYAPDHRALLLRIRYDCVVHACDSEIARLDLVDLPREDEWAFEFERGHVPPYVDRTSGRIEPLPSTTMTRDDVKPDCPDLR